MMWCSTRGAGKVGWCTSQKKKGPTALLSMPESGFFSNAFCFPEGAEKGKPWKNFGKVKGDFFPKGLKPIFTTDKRLSYPHPRSPHRGLTPPQPASPHNQTSVLQIFHEASPRGIQVQLVWRKTRATHVSCRSSEEQIEASLPALQPRASNVPSDRRRAQETVGGSGVVEFYS